MRKCVVIIKNRPLGHYLLSLFSLFLSGADEVTLKSHGSLIGKTADLVNLVTQDILPYAFEVTFENSVQDIQSIGSSFKVSVLGATLKLREAITPVVPSPSWSELEMIQTAETLGSYPRSGIDICELEILLSLILSSGIEKLQLSTVSEEEEISIGEIDLAEHKLVINEEFIKVKREELPKGKKGGDKRLAMLSKSYSTLVNALIRSAVLKPDLESYRKVLARWDDVILGLDTNLFYTSAITAYLLNEFLKIPSGNFIDSPDWMTLVVSKVVTGEIEHRATRTDTPSLDKRESLRAVQEIMIVHRSKDLEGVSMLLTGSIPSEVRFDSKETATMRDSTIREHFKAFLKSLDFYKGTYFLTQDFTNATLGEAEGLVTLYLRKPELKQGVYELLNEDKINASEIVYELSVAFLPLIVEAGPISLKIESDWEGKTLEDWEKWKLRVEWSRDKLGLRLKLAGWLEEGKTPAKMAQGWRNLRERYVSWIR